MHAPPLRPPADTSAAFPLPSLSRNSDPLSRTSRIGTERHLFCIEDPFVLSHDLGRTCHRDGVDQMKAEFKRAWQVGGVVVADLRYLSHHEQHNCT